MEAFFSIAGDTHKITRLSCNQQSPKQSTSEEGWRLSTSGRVGGQVKCA